MKSLRYNTSRRTNKALGNREASMAEKFRANLANNGTNKKRQTTTLEMACRKKKAVILQKLNKRNTHIYVNLRANLNTMNTFRENIELVNLKNLIHIGQSIQERAK